MATQRNNTEPEINPVVSYYKKMNILRAAVTAEPWKKTGEMKAMGTRPGYNYLKTDDVKNYVAPHLAAAGVEMIMNYDDWEQKEGIGGMTQHWLITLRVQFVDTDTGYVGPEMIFPGEAADSGDKALAKAQTMALKGFLVNFFLGSDGTDPDADDASVTSKTVSYTPSTAKEQMLAKSRAMQNAAKPPVKPAEPAPAPAPAAPAKPAEEAPKAPAADEPAEAPAEAPSDDAPKNPIPASKTDFTVPETNKASLDRLITGWVKAKAEGKISEAKYQEAVDAFESIGSQKDVSAWIGKYRTVKE